MNLNRAKARIKAVSDARGVIAAAVMDHQVGLKKPNAQNKTLETTAMTGSERLFAFIFFSVATMIFMLLVGSSIMSWCSHDKELLIRQTDALLAMAKYGFAAIIGLLVGWKLRK